MTKHRTVLITATLTALLALFPPALVARADIFQWEYINPANPALGKQPSTTLAPDGAGAYAQPGAILTNRNLTKAYLIGASLHGYWTEGGEYTSSTFIFSDLRGTNFSQADLTNASLYGSYLTGAILTDAEVRGTDFAREVNNYPGTGITIAQLYSTASYKAHDLTGIRLFGNDLTGANLAGQNLTNASLDYATLTGASLTGAEIRGARFHRDSALGSGTGLTPAQLYSTASYQAHDLSGIGLAGNFAGLNLAGQNLTGASFRWETDLTGANLSQANLTNSSFTSANLTAANLSHANLTNAGFVGDMLTGANLTGANLTNACFNYATLSNANLSQANLTNTSFSGATLTAANLSQANLTNANFAGYGDNESGYYDGANLTGANLTAADSRGANFFFATLTGANTSNLIQSDGHIAGLDLTSDASLVVRDYDGNPAASPPTGPLPIVVDQHLAMDATGTLRLVFDADPWDSLISFAPGIPVALAGTLDLTFAPSVDVATQSGRTIDLFDWTGVTPTGAFTISSPYTWNLTNLYTTGEVTLTAVPNLPGDFNNDGTVDAPTTSCGARPTAAIHRATPIGRRILARAWAAARRERRTHRPACPNQQPWCC